MKKSFLYISVLSVAVIAICAGAALSVKGPLFVGQVEAEPLKIVFDKDSYVDYVDFSGEGYTQYSLLMEEYTEIDNLEFDNEYTTDYIYATDGNPSIDEVKFGKDSYDNDCMFSIINNGNSYIHMSFLFDESAATLTRIIFSVLVDNVPDYNFTRDHVDIYDGGDGKLISVYSGTSGYYYVPYGSEVTFQSITFEYTC